MVQNIKKCNYEHDKRLNKLRTRTMDGRLGWVEGISLRLLPKPCLILQTRLDDMTLLCRDPTFIEHSKTDDDISH